MDVTFIDNRERSLASEVEDSLESAKGAHIAVAFARESAEEDLQKPLQKYVLSGKRMRFLAGTDFHLTQLELLERLSNPPNAMCKAYVLPSERQREFFHPKLYHFERDESVTAIVGSSNFSRGGLSRNTEANIKIVGLKSEPVLKNISHFFNRYWCSPLAREIDSEFRQRYKDAQKARDDLETSLRSRQRFREPFQSFRQYISGIITDITPREAQKWLCITSVEHYGICVATRLWGDNHWTKISHMHSGDRIIFYVKTPACALGGEALIVGVPAESSRRPWPGGEYPYQVEIEMLIQPEEPVDFRPLRELISITRGRGSSWGTSLQTSMLPLTDQDYAILHKTLHTAAREDLVLQPMEESLL